VQAWEENGSGRYIHTGKKALKKRNTTRDFLESEGRRVSRIRKLCRCCEIRRPEKPKSVGRFAKVSFLAQPGVPR